MNAGSSGVKISESHWKSRFGILLADLRCVIIRNLFEEGWRIGSGPAEVMCKVSAYRLKGAGMRWDRRGADTIMALLSFRQNQICGEAAGSCKNGLHSPCQKI